MTRARRFSPWVAPICLAVLLFGVAGVRAQGAEGELQPSQRYRLMVINVDGTGLRAIPGDDRKTYGSPDWSPDGKWIAYDAWNIDEEFNDARVEVVQADGSNLRQLGIGAMPSWSPDGKQLTAHAYGGAGAIFVMNADGSGRTAIMSHWGSPRWSPVGQRIVAANSQGGLSLYDLTTGEERFVLPDRAVMQGLSVSPDGKQVCFADGAGDLAVATIDERSGATVRTLVKGGRFMHSSWSPDGKRIVFSRRRPGDEHIRLYLIDADGDQPPERLEGLDDLAGVAAPDWSPDGKQIVFCELVLGEALPGDAAKQADADGDKISQEELRELLRKSLRQSAGKLVGLRSDLDARVWNDVERRWTTTEAAKLLIAFFRGDGSLPGFTGTPAEAERLRADLAKLRKSRELMQAIFAELATIDAKAPESPLCGSWEITGVGGAGGLAADALELYDPDPVGRTLAVANGAALLVTGGGSWLFDVTGDVDEKSIDLSAVVRSDTVYRGRYQVDGDRATAWFGQMNSPRPSGEEDNPTDGGFVLHLKRIAPE
jgi:Tol biopolymer transport system component